LDIITPLSDTLPSRGSVNDNDASITMKRIIKSVDRSLKYLDHCLERKQAHQQVFGVIQGSFSETERKRSTEETVKRKVDGVLLEGFYLGESEEHRTYLVETIISALPSQLVRMIHGCTSPEQILHMVRLGVDLFDSTYPFVMADAGYAWSVTSLNSFQKLNLWDKIHQDDKNSLAEACSCFTCRHHYMKGYIHHLLNAHEMLAHVLLSM
jgi:queuine tRNA-ribosyltransferase subunit QTRTD1